MAAPIWPNAENCSRAELETAIKATPQKRGQMRMMAIRALMLGFDHNSTAKLFNVSRDTITNWINRFNRAGIDGLLERPRSGRPRKITPDQTPRYRALIDHPEEAGQAHWTGKKFHGYLRHELQHEVGYSTVLRWLHENDYRLKVPQPWPDRQDEAARQAFVEQVGQWLRDERLERWYLDEMGVEGDPRPRRRWAQKGVKVRVTRNGDHVRMNVTGMVCPRTGQFYALEFSHSDAVILQTFLEHANRDLVLERRRNLLICDNASWHKNKKLNWGKFEPEFLPAYSPDLNPIEKLWLLIKTEWFTDFVAKDRQALMARLDQALLWAMGRQQANQKTCTIREKL